MSEEEEMKEAKLPKEVFDDILKTGEEKGEEFIKEKTKLSEDEEKEEVDKELFRECYRTIIDVLKEYCDLKEEYYPIISLWIIGTYIHKEFRTYPYLYFNAMRGSGKTRLLNLISYLSKNGKLLISMSEAVLFRTAKESTLCIDEMERIGSKDKAALRELLNAAYKYGIKVQRAKKVKDKDSEKYEIEEFEVFCPVAMANIWGMDEVLGDRSLHLILEKSDNPQITRKLEIWDFLPLIQEVKKKLGCIVCRNNTKKTIYKEWNRILSTHTLHTTHTTTNYTHNTTLFIKKVLEKSTLNSRSLELFFPLFIIADYCGELDKIIDISEDIVKEKKAEDIIENRDISLIDFVSGYEEDTKDFISIRQLIKEFKKFLMEESDEEIKWLNSKWFGVALRRLRLVKHKRRQRKGVEIILDIEKAKDKIRMFK